MQIEHSPFYVDATVHFISAINDDMLTRCNCKHNLYIFSLELTAKETVDLKVLLKLPMTKLQDLRRFLANHNIKFMPSDTHLYKDMRGIYYESYIIPDVQIIS